MAEDKTYENEVRINSFPRDNKKVNDKIYSLKADIDRIQEEFDNYKIVNAGHQKINADLRIEIKDLKEEIKHLKDPLNQLRKDGDNKISQDLGHISPCSPTGAIPKGAS